MAKTLSKTGIGTSSTIEAWHVTQSIDALTGTHAYSLTPSGSITHTGQLTINSSGTSTTTINNPTTVNNTLNITGDATVGFGDTQPIEFSTRGGENIAIGTDAFEAGTSNSGNVGVGYEAFHDTTSNGNTGVGYRVGYYNVLGNTNTHMGYQAGYYLGYNQTPSNAASGSANTAIGYRAAFYPQSMLYSNAMGYKALHGGGSFVTASKVQYAIGIGGFALYNATSGSKTIVGTTAIGYSAGYSTSEMAYSVMIGHQAAKDHETGGTRNIFIGYQAANGLTSGQHNCHIGASTTPGTSGASNEIALGYGAEGNGSNTITLGNSSISTLHCNTQTILALSDSRVKKNITPSPLGLEFINSLNPVRYQKINPAEWPSEILEDRFKEQTMVDPATNKTTIDPPEKVGPTDNKFYDGLIAQEVSASLSNLGLESTIHNTNNKGIQSIGYTTLVMPLIKAVQELSAKVTALETQISGSL